ncbi:MAG: hypothetical protein JW828_14005 [Sedimentisphaerales bacterium]|nr:hypothetical protein [Sedimentisphaerales bacterium]
MEILITIGLILLISAGLASVLHETGKFNAYELARQQCMAALQASLDSVQATGDPLSQEDIKRLWPQVAVQIRQEPGRGVWKGLMLVQGTAARKVKNRRIQVQLARYILPREAKE